MNSRLEILLLDLTKTLGGTPAANNDLIKTCRIRRNVVDTDAKRRCHLLAKLIERISLCLRLCRSSRLCWCVRLTCLWIDVCYLIARRWLRCWQLNWRLISLLLLRCTLLHRLNWLCHWLYCWLTLTDCSIRFHAINSNVCYQAQWLPGGQPLGQW